MKLKIITYNLELITTFVVLLVIGYQLLVVNAQTQNQSQIIITWQANNFYPSDFSGKTAATPHSSVTAAAELLSNQKLQDVSGADIAWYLDGNFLQEGTGLKETSFVITKASGDSYLLRAVIQPKNGQPFEKSITVPVTNPKIIIESSYPNQTVAANSQPHFQAVPYFMNINSVQDLNFTWQINGQNQASGSDNQLNLNVGSPQASSQNYLQIGVSAKSSKNPFDIFSDQIQLLIQ